MGSHAVVIAVLLASAAVRAECPLPVKPGYSIGPVRIGMLGDEARKGADFKAIDATTFRATVGTGAFSFRLGADRRVEQITLETPVVCLAEGGERRLDLTTVEATNVAPYPDCGGQVSAAMTGWVCPEHGVKFLWAGDKTSVVVTRPSLMQPYKQSPPPLPKPPQPEAKPAKAPSADAGVPLDGGTRADGGAAGDAGVVAVAEPVVDPCEGNWAPMPMLACGFFGRNETLSLECYPTKLCMGTFAPQAVGHVELHTANGEPLGPFTIARGGRTLAYKFGKSLPVGTPMRIYFDRDVRLIPPASSYSGPNPPTDPAKDPKVVGRPAAAVVGSRTVTNGWVLDLLVPASAVAPAATVEKKIP